jgi:transposase-like protein
LFKRGTKCPHCQTPYSEEFIAKAEKAKSEAQKAAYRLAKKYGEHWGRPREVDDAKVMELKKQGLSVRAIARVLRFSPGTVQDAIKRNR